jgi:hypothetical protein
MKKIYNFTNISDIKKKEVLGSLNKNHYVILRNLFKKSQVRKVLNNLKKNFSPKADKIRNEKNYDLIKTNYQRFMFGMSGGIKGALNTNPRYFRVFYNPLWCKDIYKGRDILLRLTRIQNYFYNLDSNYGINEKKTKHGLFVASRFQHYPIGGGFLAPHKDTNAIKAAKQLGISLYYNFLLIMSKKGKDYKNGGGFITKENKIISYEDIAEVGDVVIYNSKTVHGVLDIDSNLFPNRTTKEGRYIALTTLFKW